MELVVHKNTLDKHDIKYLAACRKQKLIDLTEPAHFDLYRLHHGLVSKEECTPKFMLWLIKHSNSVDLLPLFIALRGEDGVPEEVKMDAARKSVWGDILHILHNPSKAVVNAQLETAGEYIVRLKNPTQDQWCVALAHAHLEYPNLIVKCPNPTIKMQKIHVRNHGWYGLNYIEKPSEAAKLETAKHDGIQALVSPKMQKPSEQVLLTAISATYGITELKFFLHYIPHPNHKIMCAIRHQINMNKKVLAKWAAETKPARPLTQEKQLELARQAVFDPMAAAEIGKNAKSTQEQLEQLEALRLQMVANMLGPDLAH